MTDVRDLAYGSLDTFAKALDTSIEDVSFAGPAQEYAALILTRLKATFEVITLLLKNGYLDEAVVLTRRQTEDSLRLHYMYVHQDLSDGLALDLVRWREELVLKPMDESSMTRRYPSDSGTESSRWRSRGERESRSTEEEPRSPGSSCSASLNCRKSRVIWIAMPT